jgi:hypothetical protein
MSDIYIRLRQTRADMLGTDDEQHYFDCHEAAGEIERLRRWGRLTDAERERVSVVADWASEHLGQDDPGVVALRALMERLK